MEILAIICAAFLVVPFVLGYLHTTFREHRTPVLLIYFRYFMLFNMVIAGFIVAMRILFSGPDAARDTGWLFSPMFQLYAVAILSMAVMGVLTVFSRTPLVLAAPVLWLTILVLATILHAEEIAKGLVNNVNEMYVHIGYAILVCGIMLYFIVHLKQRLARTGVINHGG